jgi:hypothetical protein
MRATRAFVNTLGDRTAEDHAMVSSVAEAVRLESVLDGPPDRSGLAALRPCGEGDRGSC